MFDYTECRRLTEATDRTRSEVDLHVRLTGHW